MAIGIILVTHGEAGAAMLRAAEQKTGPISGVRAVAVAPAETPLSVAERIEAAVAELGADEVLFLVDLGGSTPFNLCCRACRGNSVVVSGMNLPMLFKLATASRGGGIRQLADELAATGAKSITVRGDGAPGGPPGSARSQP
jgi:mannose/fructose-specific phosphotransferase system component IIA